MQIKNYAQAGASHRLWPWAAKQSCTPHALKAHNLEKLHGLASLTGVGHGQDAGALVAQLQG